MRFRAAHFACLLLLLSSLAGVNARGSAMDARTPGGVFVRNLLLRAAVEETEPALSGFGLEGSGVASDATTPVPSLVHGVRRPVTHTAHVHAVTGGSL